MDQIKNQSDDRTSMNGTDEFGRVFLYTMENKTMEQTGEMRPAGWTDPLRTPIKYLVVPRHPQTRHPIFGTIRVLWAEWIADAQRQFQDWQLNLWNVGMDLSSGYLTTEQMEADPRIMKQAGPKPWPSVEAIAAASRGHQGLLGIVPTHLDDGRPNPDPLAAEARAMLGIVYLEDLSAAGAVPAVQAPALSMTDYRTFCKEAMQQGKTMSEAAELWQTHKANLKDAEAKVDG